ncbi:MULTISPECIES: hypothetical protein [Escherichia]|uniref:Uncharacterized protein n=1 Tax=Escherichia fergusonii TaxID=564 RepID=A0A8E4IRG0_ESCFE|nr:MULTISPECIES: hypothetical protein [Escherichia]QLN03060.1 hypothetical protein HVY52_24925 [Escherichia fergusonii]GDA49982.1 hypothetical protein HmCmsJML164_03419 [Escherichia coli]
MQELQKINSIMERLSALERKLDDCGKLCVEKLNELYREFFTIVSELMPIVNNCLMSSRYFTENVNVKLLERIAGDVTREMAEQFVAMNNKTKRKKALLVTANQLSGRVDFQVRQGGRVLVNDAFVGRSFSPYSMKYDVDADDQDISISWKSETAGIVLTAELLSDDKNDVQHHLDEKNHISEICMKPRSGMTLLSRTLAAGFSAPEKRVLLVVPEDADIRPLNGCDVISAKTLHTRAIPVPDVVIIDDVEKCKSVSSTATIKRILRCSSSAVVFRKQLHN